MKKLFALLLTLVLVVGAFAACGGDDATTTSGTDASNAASTEAASTEAGSVDASGETTTAAPETTTVA